jgi:hypothetical protein
MPSESSAAKLRAYECDDCPDPEACAEWRSCEPDSKLDKGLQTRRLGVLQAWMFKRGWRHLPNALSTARWLLWRATGGNYDPS